MFNHQPKNYVCPLCQIAKGEKTEHGNQEESVIFRDKNLKQENEALRQFVDIQD